MRHSLRTQLVLWNVLALALLLGALGVVIRYLVSSTIMASVDRELDDRTHQMMGRHPFGRPPFDRPPPPPGNPPAFWPPPGPNNEGNPPGPPPETGLYHPGRFGLDGKPRDLGGQQALWDAKSFALAAQGQIVYSTLTVNEVPLRILSRPLPPHGPVREVIQVPYPLTDVGRAISGLDRALLTLIPVALLCAGIGGAALTDRVLRRVRQMTHAAGQIGAHDLSKRLPVSGKDEFSALAETFNGLLGRLDSAFQEQQRLMEQQRRFTADASHELKTPLTIIKGTTSLALSRMPMMDNSRPPMQEIDAAAETMSRLVQDLLLLAQSDSGRLGQKPIELLVREILERAISRVSPSAATMISLQIAEESLSVTGNEEELVRLFANLLDNAARYSVEGGPVVVTARREGNILVIQVADSGIGIAPEHLPHLGERFYRVDSSRARREGTGGTGLGLSICKSIVEAHQGTLAFQSACGTGTVVTVTIPASAGL